MKIIVLYLSKTQHSKILKKVNLNKVMGKEEMERIKHIFSSLHLHPTYLEHEAVITSEDASKTRGFELKQGVKAILFTDDKDHWVITNVPADQRADQKKVATQMGWSKSSIRMATQEEVLEKTGCEIGAVSPFGHKTKISLLVDKKVYDNEESAFNIGLRTNSVKVKTTDLKIVLNRESAIEGDFIKN